MSGRVTILPAFTAALKQSAPSVSMQMMGTLAQPTSFMPFTTPQSSPPPPTDKTTAPGLDGREALISLTILAWPCLGENQIKSYLKCNFQTNVSPYTLHKIERGKNEPNKKKRGGENVHSKEKATATPNMRRMVLISQNLNHYL
jgi:hypothetical protein